MENKVSDNVIEKNYRECFKFNEINESGACNFDMSTAKAALENLYELYKNGISTGRFTKDKDYVVRCADLVTLACFMMHGAYGLDTLYRWAMPDGMSCGRQYEPNLQGYFQSHT
jgi:hypothetical protein